MQLPTNGAKPLILAGMLTLLSGCGDYQVDLPNGYRLVRTNASSIQIFEPQSMEYRNSPAYHKRDTVRGNSTFHDSIFVPPKIVAIGCVGDIVYGIVEASPSSENAALTVPGYFVLDTRAGDVTLGLDKAGYLKKLKTLGVTEVPALTRHIRFFRCVEAATDKSVEEQNESKQKRS
jgi:hypothetical protein